MHATQARVIIVQARKDEVYEGPIPQDDLKAIEEANALVNMAQQAWDMNAKGPQVEAILRIAAAEIPEEEKIVTEVSLADAEQTTPDPTLESGVIVQENVPEAVPEVLVDVPETEVRVERQPEISLDPDPVPVAIRGSSEKLAKVEPWEGYSTDRVPTIVETLQFGLEGEAKPLELLRHVEAYESAHKDRSRILKRVQEFRAKYNGTEPQVEVVTPTDPPLQEVPEVSVENREKVAGPIDNQTDLVTEIEKAEKEIPEAPAPAIDSDNDSDYELMLKFVQDELLGENFHVPKKLPEEKTELPFDLTTLSDRELHAVYGQFSVYAYAASYRMILEEARARKCGHAADEIHKYLLTSAEKYDSQNKPKTMTILEAEIEQNVDIKFWRKAQQKHALFGQVYKNERDSYNRLVESLSRLETMRQNEFLRSGS